MNTNGRCPRCNHPIDDHSNGECPVKVVEVDWKIRQVNDAIGQLVYAVYEIRGQNKVLFAICDYKDDAKRVVRGQRLLRDAEVEA